MNFQLFILRETSLTQTKFCEFELRQFQHVVYRIFHLWTFGSRLTIMLFIVFLLLLPAENVALFGGQPVILESLFLAPIKVEPNHPIGSNQTPRTCGGTLIEIEAVLTAVHCLFDFSSNEWVHPQIIKLELAISLNPIGSSMSHGIRFIAMLPTLITKPTPSSAHLISH